MLFIRARSVARYRAFPHDASLRNPRARKDSTRTYAFSRQERPPPLLTHISPRDPQFPFHLRLYLPAIPSVLFYLEISNDPPGHLCSLLLISGRICICLAARLLRIVRITRAKICARVYSRNNVTFINDTRSSQSSSVSG